MLARVEVRELIDAIKDIRHQLLEEDARCDSNSASQLTRDRHGKVGPIRIVGNRMDPVPVRRVLGEDVADLTPDLARGVAVKT